MVDGGPASTMNLPLFRNGNCAAVNHNLCNDSGSV